MLRLSQINKMQFTVELIPNFAELGPVQPKLVPGFSHP